MKTQFFRLYLAALLMVAGCTTMCEKPHENMTAEEVVEAYLSHAFNMNSVDDVTKLISYTSGNLKQALEEADASTIDQIFVQKKYKVDRFSFLERKDLTPREVVITYDLSYEELPVTGEKEDQISLDSNNMSNNSETPENTSQAKISIENSLNLIRKEGAWFITDVIDGQTSIDFFTPEEITPVNGTPDASE
ncbi:MAG: hypothetical protein OXC40_01850 [Proteobacteria bacterium]|nr:hypothetical protein [Pseudomonadota bacterium]